MSDWAETRAREWLKQQRLTPKYYEASLAALLDSVRSEAQTEWAPHVRADTLDEVRRIVEETAQSVGSSYGFIDVLRSRLERLK